MGYKHSKLSVDGFSWMFDRFLGGVGTLGCPGTEDRINGDRINGL